MNALEFTRAMAAAANEEAAAVERVNAGVGRQIDLAALLGDAFGKIPPVGADLGGTGGRAAGLHRGIAGDTLAPPSARTFQGPYGLMQEILGPHGEVLSVVPVGPQREPPASPFAGTGKSPAPAGSAAPSATTPAAGADAAPPGGGTIALSAALPAKERPITGTSGGKTVVEGEGWLDAHGKRVETTIPDPSVPGSSLTKGPWVNHVTWTVSPQPDLPAGGFFTADFPAPNRGLGFGGVASPQTTSGTASFNPPKGGTDFGQHFAGHASGVDSQGNPIFGGSTAGPSAPPVPPSPGDRLVAGTMSKLTDTLGRLTRALERDDGNLSYRGKGFGG